MNEAPTNGVAYAELARRTGVPRSVVTRPTDPFSFGHATRTLRHVARAPGAGPARYTRPVTMPLDPAVCHADPPGTPGTPA